MGFGGINTHVVLEASSRGGPAPRRPSDRRPAGRTRSSSSSAPPPPRSSHPTRRHRLPRPRALPRRAHRPRRIAAREDHRPHLSRRASSPARPPNCTTAAKSAAVQASSRRPRIAFLFSGQGSIPNVTTDVAQPAIVRASIERLKELRRLGIEAHCAIGHSLGELTALHWAGAHRRAATPRPRDVPRQRHAATRRRRRDARARVQRSDRAARSSTAKPSSPRRTVPNRPSSPVPRSPIERAMERAKSRGIGATRVPVNAAFHSPMMAPAASPLRDYVRTLGNEAHRQRHLLDRHRDVAHARHESRRAPRRISSPRRCASAKPSTASPPKPISSSKSAPAAC